MYKESYVSILSFSVLHENDKVIPQAGIKFESVVCGVESAPLNEICTSSFESSQIACKSHALFGYLATVQLRQKFLKRTSNLSEGGFVLNL